jgi:mannosyltransferase
MIALGLWGLARDSAMGNDEVATRWAALLSLPQLDHLVRNVDAVHGLYYLLMHGWLVLGTSPAFMRIPSVIAMAAAAAMVAVIGRRLTGSGWAGLFAGLIMALPPAISYYAQTARSYALVFACVVGLTLVLLQAMQAESAGQPGARVARWWAGYCVLVIVAGYLNEMALLVLAAHAVTVLLARPPRRTVLRWAAGSAAGVILVVPLILVSAGENAAVAWIRRPGLADLRVLFRDYFGVTTLAAVIVLICAIVALLPDRGWRRQRTARADGAAGPASARWPSPGGLTLPSVAAPLLIVPALLLIAESRIAHPYYVDRYVLYGEAGAALLAGAGIYRIGRWLGDRAGLRALTWAPGVAVCLAVLLLQLGPQHHVRTPQARMFDFGSPARYVGANVRPGDGVLFFNSFFRKTRLGYPADFRQVSDFAMAVSPAQAGTFSGTDKPPGETGALMLGYQRIWVVGVSPLGHLTGATSQEGVALQRSFRLLGEHRFRGLTVTLWLRR